MAALNIPSRAHDDNDPFAGRPVLSAFVCVGAAVVALVIISILAPIGAEFGAVIARALL